MRHYSFICTLITLLQLSCVEQVAAQRYAKARILTVENGLSDNRVNCFYKDKTGYVWIGTRNGLNRYDGHSLRVFRPAAGNAISNEIINAITGDNQGNIWVATMNGLNRYDPIRNRWECILPDPLQVKKGLPNNLVWDIQYGKDGLLWMAPDVFEFCSYDPVRRLFNYYDWPGFARTLPPVASSHYTSVQKFVAKSAHEYWLGTNRGLVLLNTSKGKFTMLAPAYNGTVRDLRYDPSMGKVFVSVDKGKCFEYDENKATWSQVTAIPTPYPSGTVESALPGGWLAAQTGIFTVTAGTPGIHLSAHVPGFSGSLLPGAVNTVYTDDRGIRWVGTDNGIAIYDPVSADTFLPLLSMADKSPVNQMGGVYFDTLSRSYFVCSLQPAMVFIIPSNGSAIRKISADADGNNFSSCNAISVDNEGNIWLMTDRHMYRYNRQQFSFTKFMLPNDGADVGFRSMLQDEQGNYWFGTYLQSIFNYNKRDRKFESRDYPFLPWTKKIGHLNLDTFRHCVWISAYGSDVIKYDLHSGRMEGFEDRPGLSALNLVNDILTDSRGNTWMATSGSGVIQFPAGTPTGSAFKHFDMRSGLPENTYTSMCEDQYANTWLLSERGFTTIDSNGKLLAAKSSAPSFGFSSYTSDSRSPHSIIFNKYSNELVAAVGGGLYFKLLGNNNASYPFTLSITGVFTNMRDSSAGQHSLSIPGRLPFRNNYLRIDFAGLYYGPPDGIVYEYLLKGYDRQWTATNNFTAVYQNLPAGKYQFQLRAKYPGGKIAGQITGYDFEIIPPFWKTDWFIAAVILLFCLAAGWLVHNLLQKINTEKIVNAFATSLYGQYTVEDICQDITRNCVIKLHFSGCVFYLFDEDRQLLLQKAAYPQKSPWQNTMHYNSTIPKGHGRVGRVAVTGKMECVGVGFRDSRNTATGEQRYSAITIPVFVERKLFGILDATGPRKNFNSRFHGRVLKKIAALFAERIGRYQAEEKLRDKIARDLHDEMGSTLTSINIMCKVAMEENAPGLKISDYLQKIKDNSGRMLESMGDMVWVINPANDDFEQLLVRMKEFTAEILEPLQVDYHFKEQGMLQAIRLNPEQRKELYMIFKEALTNAVKYSGSKELFISLTAANAGLEMQVEDRGCGFDPDNIHAGNGLRNIKNRASAIGAAVSIDSKRPGGTRIQLTLALPLSGYNNNNNNE